MRRSDREITGFDNIIKIINDCKVCHVAFFDNEYPYIVPMTFGMEVTDDKQLNIYFHGAKEGHKIDAIKNNPKVSMSIIDQEDVIEEELTTYFRSVILFGKARIL